MNQVILWQNITSYLAWTKATDGNVMEIWHLFQYRWYNYVVVCLCVRREIPEEIPNSIRSRVSDSAMKILINPELNSHSQNPRQNLQSSFWWYHPSKPVAEFIDCRSQWWVFPKAICNQVLNLLGAFFWDGDGPQHASGGLKRADLHAEFEAKWCGRPSQVVASTLVMPTMIDTTQQNTLWAKNWCQVRISSIVGIVKLSNDSPPRARPPRNICLKGDHIHLWPTSLQWKDPSSSANGGKTSDRVEYRLSDENRDITEKFCTTVSVLFYFIFVLSSYIETRRF